MEDGIRSRREVIDQIRTEDGSKDEFEISPPEQMLDIAMAPRRQIVERDNSIASLEKSVCEMGADEAGAAGYEYVHSKIVGNDQGCLASTLSPMATTVFDELIR